MEGRPGLVRPAPPRSQPRPARQFLSIRTFRRSHGGTNQPRLVGARRFIQPAINAPLRLNSATVELFRKEGIRPMSNLGLELKLPEPARVRGRHRPLGRILVDAGLIDQAALVHALEAQHVLDAPLGDILVAQGLVSRCRGDQGAGTSTSDPAGRS